ncbi:GNAT family N-acetyltransferase [Nocardioides caldifontis]|uniref:GNAT family N-acetyltransferase n=1 Tax=Nocardioides caldifontis TaxID=2588938 RepID=UPI0011DFC8E2|nr:GNAT family N-acetyltransferase [Nocardioides caldifontis]
MVELVRVTPDDWEEWREVRLRALTADPDAFGSALSREQGWGEADWRRRLAGGRDLVARVDGVTAATAGWFVREPGWGDVVAMWVAPTHRGQGLGRLLLDAVVADIGAAGLRARLWVADGNGSARRLYERAGFTPTGEQAPIRPGATLTKSLLVLGG